MRYGEQLELPIILEYKPRPGDLCRLLGDYKVEHYKCDEYPDGTVTNCVTGEVLAS